MAEDPKEPKREYGLSRTNRTFIVTTAVVILLIFHPLAFYGIAVDLAFLVIVPVLLWLILRYWGSGLDMDAAANDRLNRALAGGIAGALLVGAYLSLTSLYHSECTQQTRDGECVGDYEIVKGPDKTAAFFEVMFAGIAIWYAVSERKEEDG